MTRRAFLRALSALGCAAWARCPAQRTLYAQSLQMELARANPNIDLLVHDARTSQPLADTFRDSFSPIPVGSLLKPFLALTYFSDSHPRELSVFCRGHADRCWKAGGHGTLSLPQALAQSCNAYFLAVAGGLQADRITLPCAPPDDATPEDLIGLTARWLVSPHRLLGGYAQLLREGLEGIFDGLSLAAISGTAVRIGAHRGGVLAKTGTAPCVPSHNPCKATGDGLVFAAAPAHDPVVLLLVRQRATTGAFAAVSAGRVLSQLEALHAV